jgi:hypothetical protein
MLRVGSMPRAGWRSKPTVVSDGFGETKMTETNTPLPAFWRNKPKR